MRRVAFAILMLLVSAKVSSQTLGTNTAIPEGTCGSGVASTDLLCANSADHILSFNANNGTLTNVPQTVFVTSQYQNATTTFSNVTGLSFAVSASRNYSATCRFLQQSTTGGAGNDLKLQVTGPSAPTGVSIEWTHGETTTTVFNGTATAFSSAIDPNQTIAAGTNLGDTLHIGLINGVNAGTVQVQAALHTAAGNAQIQVGASCIVQ